MIAVDADVLGRRRTGDETYVRELLQALPRDLDLAAVTRRPDLVPDGVRAVELRTRSQELRMAWTLPRLLRGLAPALAHFVHAIPPAIGCPAVLTVQDLSFERPGLMRRRDRAIFKAVVPWSARRAAHVLAISERTKRDLVELYRIPEEKITVTPLAADPAFRPGVDDAHDDYLLFVSAIEPRKDPLAALAAAKANGMRLVVVGPERDRALARSLREGGADVRGYVAKDELVGLYQRAACFVSSSRYEGFGLGCVEAMAAGAPVVAWPDAAVAEVVGAAGVITDDLAGGVRQALGDRARLRAAGLERAARFTWPETARKTAEIYRRLA